jgi:hypothetical protein
MDKQIIVELHKDFEQSVYTDNQRFSWIRSKGDTALWLKKNNR